jgi:hypothetical protein
MATFESPIHSIRSLIEEEIWNYRKKLKKIYKPMTKIKEMKKCGIPINSIRNLIEEIN